MRVGTAAAGQTLLAITLALAGPAATAAPAQDDPERARPPQPPTMTAPPSRAGGPDATHVAPDLRDTVDGVHLEAANAAPALFSVTADEHMVKLQWNDASTNERHFVVFRRDLRGAWQAVHTIPSANPSGYGTYEWIDTVRGLDLQCYTVAAVANRNASTPEKCVVRPDSTAFPVGPASVPIKAIEWYGLQRDPAAAPSSLKNDTNHLKSLRYGKRTWGINLEWGAPSANITVKRLSSTPWPFVFGEPVALHVAGGGYLRHASRAFGISLVWSSVPVYEWRVLNRGAPGTVLGDEPKALWNNKARDFLVYGHQSTGINLRWYEHTLPPPSGGGATGPQGASAYRVWNCHANQRPLKMWVQDVTAGTPMTEVTTLQHQYLNGSCPSGQPPWEFTLTTGHVYYFRAMDYAAPGCGNDPAYGSCARSDTYLRGDAAGPVVPHTIP